MRLGNLLNLTLRAPFRLLSHSIVSGQKLARSLVPAGIPRWFAALGLLLGASYAFFMGPLRVPDELGHMYRAYLVSEGICTGAPAIGDLVDFRYIERLPWIQLSRNSTGRDLLNLVDDTHGRPLPVVAWFYAVNLYSCVPYLPAGAGFRLGRIFTVTPLTLMYLGRLANLIFYLGLALVAMRLLPGFQLLLAVLALMPMAMQQAGSLSADAVTMAVSFVMTAYVLRLALTGKPAQLQRSDYLLLLAGVVVAGLCKSIAGLVFLLLLIPAAKFPNRRTRWLAITGLTVLAFATVAIWQYINRPNGEVFATLKFAAGVHLDENAAVILHRPTLFLSAVGRTTEVLGHEYLEEFVGKLAALDIRLPGWIPWMYLVSLVVVAAAYRVEPLETLSRHQRILLIGIFLLNVGATYAVIWTTEVTHQAIATDMIAGRGLIYGLQGRYLIPFAFLPLIAASGVATQMRARWIVVPALTVVVVVNTVALHLVWNHFQAHSSTIPNRIRMALSRQFANTPETAALLYDNRVVSSRTPGTMLFLVTGGARHLVPNVMSITSRGYRWPDDILVVSDRELAAIPLGASLQAPKDYEGQLVRRAGSSGEDAKVYLVHKGQKHWVSVGNWITSHGYKWPDDVHVIPAPELAQIPEGTPIQ